MRLVDSCQIVLASLVAAAGCTTAESAESKRARGPVFTTTIDGARVERNQFPSKSAVHLDGGPHTFQTVGLAAGEYVFQVTDDSGKQLLSTDHVACRRFTIGDDGLIARVHTGTSYLRIDGIWTAGDCGHRAGVDREYSSLGALTVQLAPFRDAPDGIYRVWVTPIRHYTGNVNFIPTSDDDSLDDVGYNATSAHGFVPQRSKTEVFVVAR